MILSRSESIVRTECKIGRYMLKSTHPTEGRVADFKETVSLEAAHHLLHHSKAEWHKEMEARQLLHHSEVERHKEMESRRGRYEATSDFAR